MKLTKLVAIALAVLTVTAGAAAAMPGNAPDHAGPNDGEPADDHNDDDADGNETDVDDEDEPDDATEENETATDGDEAADGREIAEQQRNAEENRQGPPVDMPGPVPDHVSQIHDLIRQFLNGSLDGSLGKAISGVFGGGQADTAGDETAENGEGAQSG